MPPYTRHTYATAEDLAAYPVDVADESEIPRLLADASAAVDDLLECAVYDVDDDGMPTESKVQRALALATCAVVGWWEETGTDGARMLQSASIAGVSLGWRSSGNKGSEPDRWGHQARRHLRDAGLLGMGPYH